MGLTFENNTIENFDVQATFGMMNFLEVVAINERDGVGYDRLYVVRDVKKFVNSV